MNLYLQPIPSQTRCSEVLSSHVASDCCIGQSKSQYFTEIRKLCTNKCKWHYHPIVNLYTAVKRDERPPVSDRKRYLWDIRKIKVRSQTLCVCIKHPARYRPEVIASGLSEKGGKTFTLYSVYACYFIVLLCLFTFIQEITIKSLSSWHCLSHTFCPPRQQYRGSGVPRVSLNVTRYGKHKGHFLAPAQSPTPNIPGMGVPLELHRQLRVTVTFKTFRENGGWALKTGIWINAYVLRAN